MIPTLSKYIEDRKGEEITFNKCQSYDDITNYNEFWASTPHLSHFIRCNAKGEPLEKPKYFYEFERNGYCILTNQTKLCREWDEAEKRLKWTGWEWEDEERICIVSPCGEWAIKKDNILGFMYWNTSDMCGEEIKSYGQLITAKVPLEPTEGCSKELKLK